MNIKLIIILLFVSLHFSINASEIKNIMCPVLIDEPSEASYKTIFKDKNLYFCCKKCVNKFNADPDKYEKNIKYSTYETKRNSGHDHSNHQHGSQNSSSSIDRILTLFGKMHPILVHFPIAGIYFVFLLQMASFTFPKKDFRFPIRFLLILTLVSIIITGLSGWSNSHFRSFTGEDLNLIYWHRLLGILSSILMTLTAIFNFISKENKGRNFGLYIILLLLSIGITSLTGHFGGMLVFGSNYFDF